MRSGSGCMYSFLFVTEGYRVKSGSGSEIVFMFILQKSVILKVGVGA